MAGENVTHLSELPSGRTKFEIFLKTRRSAELKGSPINSP
jgi:hypothetical protein